MFLSPLNQGLRIKIFSTSATNVKPSNIINVALYPPVASRTLFDAVAIKEPIITVKVIIATLFEKCFIPKNEEVNAVIIVGHEP